MIINSCTLSEAVRGVAANPDDDHVIAVAMAAAASLIVSGDRAHLLSIGDHAGISLVSPRAALELLRR